MNIVRLLNELTEAQGFIGRRLDLLCCMVQNVGLQKDDMFNI